MKTIETEAADVTGYMEYTETSDKTGFYRAKSKKFGFMCSYQDEEKVTREKRSLYNNQ